MQRTLQQQQQQPPTTPPASSGPPVIDPSNPSVMCDECKQPIAGAGIQALGKIWHSSCFKCEACKKPLTGTFMNTNGRPYCQEDYQRLFAKTCAGTMPRL